ncbi:MAG: hypothetical protein ACLGH0_01870, partial [Thermoanaerobaculia bacterium]
MTVPCPTCGTASRSRGVIPEIGLFAGQTQAQDVRRSLYACPACELQFKWPQRAKEDVDALY